MDNVLIFGSNQAEHDVRLANVLTRIQETGVTLNTSNCKFIVPTHKFLGHVIDAIKRIRPDPEKVETIRDLQRLKNVFDMRRCTGIVNQLSKYSPNIAEISQPLLEFLSSKRSWLWEHPQEQAFTQLKEELISPTVFGLYEPRRNIKVSANTSSHGLGAVLLQATINGDTWKSVAYVSRSMTETKKRYDEIEKGTLAASWTCDKFSDYVLGQKFHIETDHKPLFRC